MGLKKTSHSPIWRKSSDSFLPAPPESSIPDNGLRSRRKLIQVSERNSLGLEMFRNAAGFLKERRRHEESKYNYIIHPLSDFVCYWNIILMLTFLSTYITAPIIMTFAFLGGFDIKWIHYVERVSIVIYITNICLRCFIGYVDEKTKRIILEHPMILRHYLLSFQFLVDFLSTVTFLIFDPLIDMEKYSYLIFIRVLSLLMLWKFFLYWTPVLQYLGLPNLLISFGKYFFLTTFLIHWLTCFMILVIKFEGLLDEFQVIASSPRITRDAKNSFMTMYILGFLKTFSVFICARSMWTPSSHSAEIAFSLFTMIVGKIYILFLLVVAFNRLLLEWSRETEYLEMMDNLDKFMDDRKLPTELRGKLTQFYEYEYENKYFEKTLVTSILSDRLNMEINTHVFEKLLQNDTSFLKYLSPEAITEILINLKPEMFLPNHTIITAGSLGDWMYFLFSGTVMISTPTGKEVCRKFDGEYFGEVELLSKGMPRCANVTALEICETYKLHREIFKSAVSPNVECLKEVQAIAEKFRQRTDYLEEMAKGELFHKTYIGEIEEEEDDLLSIIST